MSNSETDTKQEKPWEQFFGFFLNKYIAGLGVLITIVSLPLTIYLFFLSDKSPSLTYKVNPIKYVLVDKSNDASISVKYKNQDVKGNIYALQIAIWNSGSKEIRKEDILESVSLNYSKNIRILDVKTIEESRSIIGFGISGIASSNTDKPQTSPVSLEAVTFQWKILEKNDSVLVQVIYEGSASEEFSLNGTIVGQNQILKFESKVLSPYFNIFLLSITMLSVVFYIQIIYLNFKIYKISAESKNPLFKNSLFYVKSLLASTAFVIFAVWIYLKYNPPSSPFGF